MNGIEDFPDRRLAFCEEARDLLADLEAALLHLEADPADQETIGRIFRALHTIKGSGAMFGFDAVADFTHNIESAYDLVRSGRLAVQPLLISLTLNARDHILHLLDTTVNGGSLCRTAGQTILDAIQTLIDSPGPSAPLPESPEGEPSGADYRIRFVPPAGLFERGGNLLPVFAELRELGDLSIRADLDALPPLNHYQPDQCYLAFDMALRTAAPQDAIRDVFVFVDDGDGLTLTGAADPLEFDFPPAEPPADAPAPVAAPTPALAVAAPEPAPAPSAPAPSASAPARPAPSSLRVSAAKLDDLINIVGELVTMQARLARFAAQSGDIEISHIAEETERLTNLLRDNTMSIRMVPIESTFTRYRRLVRDLAAELGKEIELVTEGGDTELDKSVIDQIADPLVHLIRNSLDHGIEAPADRLQAGKPAGGRLILSASHSGSQVLIRVTDDGRGIDPARVRAKAIEKGLIDPAAELTEAETFALIFRTGFSTAAAVSSVSGRGVGMDVVKRNVEALRGSIDLTSTPGQGTVITLRLPLTLAIIDGLLVRVSGQSFVFPVAQVVACLEAPADDFHSGREFIEVREQLVPLVFLPRFFGLPAASDPRVQILIAQTSAGQFGFVVDEVIGDHKTVIKQLGPLYRHVEGVSGATILGDGGIALILDADKLAHAAIDHALCPA